MAPWIMSLELGKKHLQRMVKCFYRKYIKYIKKHHSFLLCKYEKRKAIRLDRFLKDKPTTYSCKPFGILPKCTYHCFDRPTEFGLDVIRALIDLLDLVHLAGFSFNGKLLIKNLYWVPETKTIKIAGLAIGDMVKKNEERMKSDFKCQHNMITDVVFAGSKVPRELRHLLRFMISNPIQYRALIANNICLVNDEAKVGRYNVLYQKLSIIKQKDRNIFQKALSFISCGKCDRLRNWKRNVYRNDALKVVHDYKKIPGYYSSDADGVTWFGRNVCGHVTDNSVGVDNGGQKVIKYTTADIFPMLEFHIPGLFSEIEEAVFVVVMIDNSLELQCLVNNSTSSV